METKNIMIVGVGGQGSLLASKLLGHLLMEQGYDVKVSEVHGMSQRGGSVVTYVRYGDRVNSPVIDRGEADFIVSFELLEAARIDGAGFLQQFWYVTLPNIKGSLALCALLRTIDTFRLFEKVNVLTGGGPAGTTTTITQFLYTYGIKSLDFGFGSAGAIVMTLLVLILSSFYIKRAMG